MLEQDFDNAITSASRAIEMLAISDEQKKELRLGAAQAILSVKTAHEQLKAYAKLSEEK